MVQSKSIVLLKIIFALLFCYSGIVKLIDIDQFANSMKTYEILPEGLVPFMAIYVAAFEVALAVAFLIPGFGVQVSVVCGGMVTIFQFALASLVVRGIDIDCGCFGKFASTPQAALVRNFVILSFIGLLLFLLYKNKKLQNSKSFASLDID